MKKIIACILVVFYLTGCKNDIPKPESFEAHAAEKERSQSEGLIVRHLVYGNKLLVECMIPSVSFSNIPNQKTGEIVLYVNGELYGKYDTAAFIVKNLPKGNHDIKVDIVDRNNRPLGLSKQFSITII